jgi:apolipoprotein N-acyltransferase
LSKVSLIALGVFLLLAALPNPLAHAPLLIFAAFVPLLVGNQKLTGWPRVRFNFAFCYLSFIGLTSPLDSAALGVTGNDLLVLAAAFGLAALLYTVIFAVTAALADRGPGWAFPLYWSAGWLISQWLCQNLPFLIPGPIETALVPWPVILQSANIFGATVIGGLIFLTNAVLAFALADRSHAASIWLLVVTLLHLGNLGYGWSALRSDLPADETVTVALVQPNISAAAYQKAAQNKLLEYGFWRELEKLTALASDQGAELVIWPELSGTALPAKPARARTAELLYGTISGGANAAVIGQPDGSLSQPYCKTILFPFAESFTYRAGRAYQPLPSATRLERVGALICLESLYPAVAQKLVRHGAACLALLSTDAAFGNSTLPYIHKNALALRAIENNRYAFHVSNTGPSAAFDERGRELALIPYGERGFVLVGVPAARLIF